MLKLYNKMVSSNLFRIDWQVWFYRWWHVARDGITESKPFGIIYVLTSEIVSNVVGCDRNLMDPDGCIMTKDGVTTVYHTHTHTYSHTPWTMALLYAWKFHWKSTRRFFIFIYIVKTNRNPIEDDATVALLFYGSTYFI